MSSPSPQPSTGGSKMSSSLRERLKRSRRSFYSPNHSPSLSRLHPPCSKDTGAEKLQTLSAKPRTDSAIVSGVSKGSPTESQNVESSLPESCTAPKGSLLTRLSVDLKDHMDTKDYSEINDKFTDNVDERCQDSSESLIATRNQLQEKVLERKETLRKLKMVKMYRNKNDLENLQHLINKWRQASRDMLLELQDKLPMDNKPKLQELIKTWNLDPELLQFDEETDSFLE